MIKAYWWNKILNFGDAMAPMLIELATQQKAVWTPPEDATVVGLGSILNKVIRDVQSNKKTDGLAKPNIWGTGLMAPFYFPKKQTVGIELGCVRGYLTASCLEQNVPYIGDPGLLVRVAYPELLRAEKKYRGCICLHHTQALNERIISALKERDWIVLSAGTNDFLAVIKTLASSEVVISSSLHGLVVADSFMVPNAWFLPKPIHIASEFKFFDYFSSINREMGQPIRGFVNIKDFELARQRLLESYEGYYMEIERRIADLLEASMSFGAPRVG